MNNDAKVKELLEKHKDLINFEVGKYSSNIPAHVLRAQAYKIAAQAAREYDEKTGNKFSTFLVNRLQKLSRTSTQYGNLVRVPENKQFKLNRLSHIEKELDAELGRTPTVSELSDATGHSLSEIHTLLQTRKSEASMSNISAAPVFMSGENEDWLHYVYHDLAPRDKLIFEHKYGFGRPKAESNEHIAKILDSPITAVNKRIWLINKKIEEGAK
jgi:DNA-directed RNA polymerase sigma subunit (sigma70/sigma32)